MKNGRFQAALLGCGNISEAHAKAIAANNDIMDMYACCDIIEEKAVARKEEYGAQVIYTDYLEMLRDPVIDLVCICTPSGMHAEHAIACAKAGKNCLCEKPLDVTTEKMDAIEAAFAGAGAKCACVFQYRTHPGIREAKRLIDSGELGRVLLSNGYTKFHRSPKYYKSAGWRGTWALDGGGSTMNQGVHIVDLTVYLGGGVESVLAKIATLDRDIEVEDTSYAIFKLKSGGMGSYTATVLYNPAPGVRVEVVCEKGQIVFDGKQVILYRDDQEFLLDEVQADNVGDSNVIKASPGHAYLLRDLAIAVQDGREPFVPVAKGRHAVDVILAMYRSSRENREISL